MSAAMSTPAGLSASALNALRKSLKSRNVAPQIGQDAACASISSRPLPEISPSTS
jgi:hypothetical protein